MQKKKYTSLENKTLKRHFFNDAGKQGFDPEAGFLNEIQTVLGVLLLAIHSRLYNFALRFLFPQTHAPLQFLRRKVERRKT
jgi:hypothetical protein